MVRKISRKDDRLQIRIGEEEKNKLKQEAESLGMTLSAYINEIVSQRQIVVISEGEKLVKALCDFNNNIAEITRRYSLPVKEVQNKIGKEVVKLNRKFKGGE